MVKSELSGQTVLMMEMVYETKDRKPFKFARIVFESATFDQSGVRDIEDDSTSKEFSVRLDYILSGIAGKSNPLPIPIAPLIPTEKEISAIKTYINKKYPNLLINTPTAIEQAISISIKRHRENVKKMKESHK